MKISEIIAEAGDSKFAGFMNKALGTRIDQTNQKNKSGQDWYDRAPEMGLDSGMASYKPALDFCMKTIKKLTPTQKIKLSTKGEEGVVDWLAAQAKKQGLLGDENESGQFMWEDIDEVQAHLPDIFKDPEITSWALVLTDGEPLPKAPGKGPFTISINPGIPPGPVGSGYSTGWGIAGKDWVNVDTLDNIADAEEIFKGLIKKNPKHFVGVADSSYKWLKFHDPHHPDRSKY